MSFLLFLNGGSILMEKYLDKFKVEIDYENQPFEKMENNPYEIVIANGKICT